VVYRQIMLAGKRTRTLTCAFASAENEVNGCESQVWLTCTVNEQQVYLQGDSPSKNCTGFIGYLYLKYLKVKSTKYSCF